MSAPSAALISVDEARARVLALARPLPAERVALRRAAGRALAEDVVARRDQPPIAASAMDGYAVAGAPAPGAALRVIGTAQAGARFAGRVGPGQAVRIFTGAPVPEGCDRIVIQEDATVAGDTIALRPGADAAHHIRPAGGDFRAGDRLAAPRRLRPADLALIAAMGWPDVAVARRPVVAVVATGDEIVMPGTDPGPDQIVASNLFALLALAEAEAAETRMLPVARDDAAALAHVLAQAADADVIVTIGGASVGDRDLVAPTLAGMGMTAAFHRIAMRPGKPLMAGRLGDAAVLGVPGNPVSAIVCAMLFLVPLLRAMQGLPAALVPRHAALARALGPNGPREHYMRARLLPGPGGLRIDPWDDQDSARLRLLCDADALMIRPAHDPAQPEGAAVAWLPL
jgi:molybdopterin molybdotransferase